MVYGGYKYLDFNYVPKESDFLVLSWVKGNADLEVLAEGLAAESSVGTWTKIKTMNEHVFRDYRARVYNLIKVRKNAGFVYLAYPYEHFDSKNLLQFFASVLGNVYGLKEIEELSILDIKFPKKFQKQFSGPKFGLEGVRKYVGTIKSKRPHAGTIVKPKVGLSAEEWSEVAYKSFVNGLDFVKDDENLVDQEFCKWQERFDLVFDKMSKAEDKTGEKKLYASNITDMSIERMYERIDHIVERGSKCVMLDVFILGFALTQELVKYAHKKNLIVHAHRAGFAAMHRGSYGYDFKILLKIYRMIGVDQLHIGTGVGKMEGSSKYISYLHDLAENQKVKGNLYLGSLDFEYGKHIKPIMSVASGGLDAGKADALAVIHGKNFVLQGGGGVHGHPLGTEGGAKSMRQAAEAVGKGIPLPEYAKKHKELKIALEHFGYVNPKTVRDEINLYNKSELILNTLVRNNGMDILKHLRDEGIRLM